MISFVDTVAIPNREEQITEIMMSSSIGSYSDLAGRIVIAYEDDLILGVGASMPYVGPSEMLNGVAVRKGYWRRGIGSQIIKMLINSASPECEVIWLETIFWNRRFYDSLGFGFAPIAEVKKQFDFDPRFNRNTMMMSLIRGVQNPSRNESRDQTCHSHHAIPV